MRTREPRISRRSPVPRHLAQGLVALGALLWLAPGVAGAEAETVGKVVAVRGEVTARSTDGTTRTLQCADPVYAGDRIEASDDGALGVMSGGVYTGIGGGSRLALDETDAGSPDVDLESGHVRVLDSAPASEASPRLTTPGLLARDTGRDTEALVFPEKVWVVSMVCAYDDPVEVSRRAKADESAETEPGTCSVDKPREPLYAAPATHPRLPVIDDDCGFGAPLAMGPAASHFGSPADVALGPDVAAAFSGPNLGSPIAGAAATELREPCDIGNTCRAGAGGAGLRDTPFVPIAP